MCLSCIGKQINGEVQQKSDVFSHNILVKSFETVPALAGLLSEEAKDAIAYNYKTGEYLLAVDPLDGSSNIDVNASIGTIFSIYSRRRLERSHWHGTNEILKSVEPNFNFTSLLTSLENGTFPVYALLIMVLFFVVTLSLRLLLS